MIIMIDKKWHCMLVILSLGWLSGCNSTKYNQRIVVNKDTEAKTKQLHTAPPITIWVHGTFFFPNYMLPKFFYCPTGLNLATDLDKSYHHRSIAETLAQADPERFPLETFYLFGWSSKLSFPAREEAAKQLYNELKKLIVEYKKKHGQKPVIRIITHSHGGNVALNMAQWFDPNDEIKIKELILLACPVQERTKQLTQSTLFTNIVSLFSTLDAVQVLDPQGLYPQEIRDMQTQYDKEETPLFSQRAFQAAPNVMQAQIKLNERDIFHIEFMLQRFLQLLPTILDNIEQWQHEDKADEQIYLLKLTI